jgi:chromobox protein 1
MPRSFTGEVNFMMKWKGSDGATFIPSKVANIKFPQIVIKFYEERLRWNSMEPAEK